MSAPEIREKIVAGMLEQLRVVELEKTSQADIFVARRTQSEAERIQLSKKIGNLATAIGAIGGSAALLSDLRAAEVRLAQLDKELSGASTIPQFK